MNTRYLKVWLFYCLSLSAGQVFPQPAERQIEIAESFRPLLQQLSAAPPAGGRISMIETKKVMEGTALPKTALAETHQLRLMPNGVVVDTLRTHAEKFAMETTGFSACGVFELAGFSGTEVSWQQTTFAPIGKLMLPFTINNTATISAVGRIAEASGDLAQACSPEPGSSYKYHLVTTTEITSKMLVTRRTETRAVQTFECTVGTSEPASSIHPQLRGHYLPVQCEVSNEKGIKSTQKSAFFLNDRYQIPLSSHGSQHTMSTEIVNVGYAE